MNRRTFIKKTSLTAAGVIAAPYILPSGRLFAASGARLVNHVVLVVFGGGIRNQETVMQQYLSNQFAGPSGNVMYNMLSGSAPVSSLVYDPWSPAVATPLSQQGTLYRHMKYASGPTGHFNGHTVVLTGNYTETGLNLNINPEYPTLFEYYRKHSDPAKSAMNAWWVSLDLGPYPALNYSRHPDYGPNYGANYISPLTTLGSSVAYDKMSSINALHPEELTRLNSLRSFLDSNFNKSITDIPGIVNTAEEREEIQDFILKLIQGEIDIEWPLPPGVPEYTLTGDLFNVAAAWQVINQFHPELLVINTTNLDVCHTDFSGYIQNLHKADFGMGWLWNKIQNDPIMGDDTIMIMIPEHGRNLDANTLVDANGLFAYDHTSDDNSRKIFGLIVGPPDVVNQGLVLGTDEVSKGQSIDIVPTVANILGFKDAIPPYLLPGNILTDAFI